MKKFLDQDFSGAALAEFKREVSGAVTSRKIDFSMHILMEEIYMFNSLSYVIESTKIMYRM